MRAPQGSAPPWPYLATVADQLAGGVTASQGAFRTVLTLGDAELKRRFEANEPIEWLVRDRAKLVDAIVLKAWTVHASGCAHDLDLIAVGGYGRGELHPHSDIDVMILLPGSDVAQWQAQLELFLTFLWDIGLEVGHSVRTISECQQESLADISVATNLLEARLLIGPQSLFIAMGEALAPQHVWSASEFYEGKVREQINRHARYHDTAYNLEPNVKASPGGLRDIQTIAWVAKRYFGADSLDGLLEHGFLTKSELNKLKTAQALLWKIRFALHIVNGRREDRLLFDNQIRLAREFGYEDASYTLAVEQFMQRYYRTVMDISLLNEMLLQLFREAILNPTPAAPVAINARFQSVSDYIEATSDDVFVRNPSAILELFLLLMQTPSLRGVRAATLRSLQDSLWLIDEEFRQNPRHHRLFLEILRQPKGVTRALRRMNLYGVLGRYIPAFGRIVGRMQYDLFHAYTVDAHLLFVVRNLRRFALDQFAHEFPRMNVLFKELPRPEIAYLAGLFHDVAKGRGGDHSELGAVDAEAFCLEQGLSRYDARLVAWLVRHHLELSITAQKQDISDPEVINELARRCGDLTHLNYLYVLTVADVRGTSPKLWNTWKASLFETCYDRVQKALRRGLESPLNETELAGDTQTEARALLGRDGVAPSALEQVWKSLDGTYFLRHTAEEIAWHTALLASRDPFDEAPLVAVRQETARGGTAIFSYSRHRLHTFACITAVLDQMGLTILDARITPTVNDFSLETYLVLEDTGGMITDRERIHDIEKSLLRNLENANAQSITVTRRATRQTRLFTTKTQLAFSNDERNHRTVLNLIAADRPGLLSAIGQALVKAKIELHGARIATVGERAEDVFYITDIEGSPLDPTSQSRLASALSEALDPIQERSLPKGTQ